MTTTCRGRGPSRPALGRCTPPVPLATTALSLTGLDEIPGHARNCVFWMVNPDPDSPPVVDPGFEVEAWLSMVMLEWGACGSIAWHDGHPVGHAVYAPPTMIPRAGLFPTSPVSADAILLATISADPALHDDASVSGALFASVLRDLSRRGVRAVEAFGYRVSHEDESPFDPEALLRRPAPPSGPDCSPIRCMTPADVWTELGFEKIAAHHRFPRFRLELGHGIGWKSQVEAALDSRVGSTGHGAVQRQEPLVTVGTVLR